MRSSALRWPSSFSFFVALGWLSLLCPSLPPPHSPLLPPCSLSRGTLVFRRPRLPDRKTCLRAGVLRRRRRGGREGPVPVGVGAKLEWCDQLFPSLVFPLSSLFISALLSHTPGVHPSLLLSRRLSPLRSSPFSPLFLPPSRPPQGFILDPAWFLSPPPLLPTALMALMVAFNLPRGQLPVVVNASVHSHSFSSTGTVALHLPLSNKFLD